MSKSYEIGFSHGNTYAGTLGYKPGNRKSGGSALREYDAGFDAGMSAHHESTRLQRAQLAWLNEPKKTRGPRPQ